jgi:hypothetical protein
MKAIVIVFITIFSTAISTVASATDSSTQNPVYGKWLRTDHPDCPSTYSFHRDGTMKFISKPEISENRFTISKTPDSNGLYRIEYTITKTNGRMPCDSEGFGEDEVLPVGFQGSIYVYFRRNNTEMFVCPDTEIDLGCAGPYQRGP